MSLEADPAAAPPTADEPAAERAVAAAPIEAVPGTGSAVGAPTAPVDPAAHRCDVLIADDTGHSREILATLLRELAPGLSIHQVRDGSEAIAAWRDLQPRITFLDIDMPRQDGLSVLKAIRSVQPDAFVAMVSGYSSPDNVREALSMGASGFIVKPYKPQRIADTLERFRKASGRPLGQPA